MRTAALAPCNDRAFDQDGTAAVALRRRSSRAAAPSRPTSDETALVELARRAGYRIETASVAGLWLLIDADSELARTPRGERAWSAAEARRRLEAFAPRAC
jgi:hypothetical protein